MAETTISIPELAKALQRIKTLDELRCFGCGYEHNCSLHGCVIIREAANVIEKLGEHICDCDINCGTCFNLNNYSECLYACNSIECYMDDTRQDCYCRGCVDHSKWQFYAFKQETKQDEMQLEAPHE